MADDRLRIPHERFTHDDFLAADDARRGALCTELAELLTARLAGVRSFHGTVTALVAELRTLGHDLWSFDEDDDFETWCPSWGAASGPGLVITFRIDRVEVTWSQD